MVVEDDMEMAFVSSLLLPVSSSSVSFLLLLFRKQMDRCVLVVCSVM
jgi:hypothetical protein